MEGERGGRKKKEREKGREGDGRKIPRWGEWERKKDGE